MKHFLLRGQRLRAQKGDTLLFSDLWINIVPGEVTGVIGLSSEGKSALTAILSGLRQADSGTIFWQGERLTNTRATHILQTSATYVGPEDVLIDTLSLSDNLMLLGQKYIGCGLFKMWVNEARIRKKTAEYLALAQIDREPTTLAGELNADERHRLEFLRALVRGSPLIVFNTPLKRAELVANEPAFKSLLDYARKCGVGIVMMFNNVDRLMRLCDRAVIVRDGHTVHLCEKAEFDRVQLLQLMDAAQPIPTPIPPSAASHESALALCNAFTADGNLKGLSLNIGKSEITGVVCRDDEWNGWFVEALQGFHPLSSGEIRRNGVPCTAKQLRRTATGENRSFFIIGSEHLGLLQHMTALDNLLLPIQNRAGGMLGKVGRDLTAHLLQLCIENGILSGPEEASLPVSAMSTERKLLIWIVRARLFHPDLCVFLGLQEENHPQQRELIHSLAQELAMEGAGVLMISTQKYPMSEIVGKLYFVEDGRISPPIK